MIETGDSNENSEEINIKDGKELDMDIENESFETLLRAAQRSTGAIRFAFVKVKIIKGLKQTWKFRKILLSSREKDKKTPSPISLDIKDPFTSRSEEEHNNEYTAKTTKPKTTPKGKFSNLDESRVFKKILNLEGPSSKSPVPSRIMDDDDDYEPFDNIKIDAENHRKLVHKNHSEDLRLISTWKNKIIIDRNKSLTI